MTPKSRTIKKHTGITAGITGLGAYLPKKVMTNADLEKLVDTSDEVVDIINSFYSKYLLKPNF